MPRIPIEDCNFRIAKVYNGTIVRTDVLMKSIFLIVPTSEQFTNQCKHIIETDVKITEDSIVDIVTELENHIFDILEVPEVVRTRVTTFKKIT